MFKAPSFDMNSLVLEGHQTSDYRLADPRAVSEDGRTTVHFRDLERHLIGHILRAPVVVGCVAWLTSEQILEALSRCEGVSIVVQKEDFLRPDYCPRPNWARKLRTLYDALPGSICRSEDPVGILAVVSTGDLRFIEPIRCVGNHNRDRAPASPRSHHKFVVFSRYRLDPVGDTGFARRSLEPYAAWTGSFNFTKNATCSLENALYTTDRHLARAFFEEWSQVCAFSELLDWESEWSVPEWRVGT